MNFDMFRGLNRPGFDTGFSAFDKGRSAFDDTHAFDNSKSFQNQFSSTT